MDIFRVRTHASLCKILVAISGGVSSLSLLHILDGHIIRQKEKTKRQAYTMSVLYVDESCLGEESLPSSSFDTLKIRYPSYEFHRRPIEDLFEADFLPDEEHNNLISSLPQISAQANSASYLQSILSSLPSSSSRIDLKVTLRTRLIAQQAKLLNCEVIAWGDTTTRLAERTLAETSKGRGFALPWQTGNSLTPHGIRFIYPLQDIYRKELHIFASLCEPPIMEFFLQDTLEQKQAVSSKSTSIDDLMRTYFESVELNYPNIVANVVKTSNRLVPPVRTAGQVKCRICSLAFDKSTTGIEDWEGNQQVDLADGGQQTQNLCYGCFRTVQNAKSVAHTK
jgi:cytoplasmic tRNA 2-thiolation protein 2